MIFSFFLLFSNEYLLDDFTNTLIYSFHYLAPSFFWWFHKILEIHQFISWMLESGIPKLWEKNIVFRWNNQFILHYLFLNIINYLLIEYLCNLSLLRSTWFLFETWPNLLLGLAVGVSCTIVTGKWSWSFSWAFIMGDKNK